MSENADNTELRHPPLRLLLAAANFLLIRAKTIALGTAANRAARGLADEKPRVRREETGAGQPRIIRKRKSVGTNCDVEANISDRLEESGLTFRELEQRELRTRLPTANIALITVGVEVARVRSQEGQTNPCVEASFYRDIEDWLYRNCPCDLIF